MTTMFIKTFCAACVILPLASATGQIPAVDIELRGRPIEEVLAVELCTKMEYEPLAWIKSLYIEPELDIAEAIRQLQNLIPHGRGARVVDHDYGGHCLLMGSECAGAGGPIVTVLDQPVA